MKFLIDHDPRHHLPLRIADHPVLVVIDREAFLLTDLIDPPSKSPQVERLRFLEREGQVVGVSCICTAAPFGESAKPGIEPSADQVRYGWRRGCSLRKHSRCPVL